MHWLLITIGLLVVAGAASPLWRVLRARRNARLTAVWLAVKGRIVESELTFKLSGGHRHSWRRYGARVVYEYSVMGMTYRSERVTFADATDRTRPQPAQRIVNRYPRGTQVEVYCNPREPQTAVLERGTPSISLAQIVTALVAGLIGAALALLGAYLATR